MPNVIASATTVVNGTIKRNDFLIGVNTSVQYGPTSATTFWNGIVPPTSGYTVYAQKTVNGPSIRTAANDSELITIAKQYGGTSVTTAQQALNYFNGLSNFLVTNIDYPNIVTSGLTILLDAAYVPSYPTSGTTWTDLSGNGYNGTLTNATFSSANGGTIVFNGSSTYVLFNNTTTILSGLSEASMCMWINVTRRSGGGIKYQAIGGWRNDTNADFYFLLVDGSGASVPTEFRTRTTTGLWDVSVSYLPYFGSWTFISTVVSNNRTDLYINGSLVGSNTNKTGSFGASSNQFRIGTDSAFPSLITYPMQGSMSNYLVYNRALSASEVLQNYNATKSRFGL